MSKSIVDAFSDYFELIPATTEQQLREVFSLRYHVYCLETGFEDPNRHPEQTECDEFDKNSIHYLIYHKHSATYPATTRLILPDKNDPAQLFPIELHCQIDTQPVFKDIPRLRIGEVSRFCVSKDFKRRKNEAGTLTGINPEIYELVSEDERRTFPHITLGLFTCLIKISAEQGIDYWFAVMEPALIRFLATLGMHFIPIGPLAEYHGKRQPTIIKVSDLLIGVQKKNPEVWEILTLKGQFSQPFE